MIRALKPRKQRQAKPSPNDQWQVRVVQVENEGQISIWQGDYGHACINLSRAALLQHIAQCGEIYNRLRVDGEMLTEKAG